ncbi:hypothetical protein GCM10023224_04660 [Streptomonospora halophila]|uniref:Uncharacterized protein n=1 Tax=Streptomonospora halophila TaxID=427369 RepID=A0ABP9GBL0_9ACTN
MVQPIEAHASQDATPADHIAEAGRLLDDVWLMVYQDPRYGWESPAATNMLAAADIHTRIADLKSRT